MTRTIRVGLFIGIGVACFWAVVGLLAGHNYNLGRSTVVAITAPASLLGRRMPLSVLWFVFLNGCLYAVAAGAVGFLRRLLPRH